MLPLTHKYTFAYFPGLAQALQKWRGINYRLLQNVYRTRHYFKGVVKFFSGPNSVLNKTIEYFLFKTCFLVVYCSQKLQSVYSQ